MAKSSMHAFAMSVKPPHELTHRAIDSQHDAQQLQRIVSSLLGLPHVSEIPINDLKLASNPRDWIRSILSQSPDCDESLVRFLLRDFTDCMKTRMREDRKYVLSVTWRNHLFLCHSALGQQTITPEWKTIPRMLDSDNVLRFACFRKSKDTISIFYWERQATESFTHWLGLPRKSGYLTGGRYRLVFKLDGQVSELQLSDEEMERWIKAHDELRESKLYLREPLKVLEISEICVGNKRFTDTANFLQTFEAERQGFFRYQRDYERLANDSLPLLCKYIDDKAAVLKYDESGETVAVSKEPSDVEVLFANASIELRDSYLSDLTTRLLNGQTLKLCHAGNHFEAEPFTFRSLKVFNRIAIPEALQVFADHFNQDSLLDSDLDLAIKIAVLTMLADSNEESPIAYVLHALVDKARRHLKLNGNASDLEGRILEYKSRDILSGKQNDIVEELASDIETKLESSLCKLYIIGIEDSGEYDPIPRNRMKSDRLSALQEAIQKKLGISQLQFLPVSSSEAGLLVILAKR